MRALALAALAVALVALAIPATIYLGSEWRLRQVPQIEPFRADIPTDQAAIRRGGHVARTRGCFGCHGQDLSGQVFTEQWDWVERAVAPNLAKSARRYDPATLERIIRHGILPDGRATFSMPSYNWVHLSDTELTELIAFLRAAPVVERELPVPALGWAARWRLFVGEEQHLAEWATWVPPLRTPDDPVLARGERLAMTMCNECHGLDLRGGSLPPPGPPDLAIVASYSKDEFLRLMNEGVAKGGRTDLGLMSLVQPDRFPYLSDGEKHALYAFLQTLPSEPVPGPVRWR